MAELQNPLPSGWDCQYDRKSGKYYYVNHFTKTTTWEDPRLQQKPRHPAAVEHIIMQDLSHISRSSPRTTRLQDSPLSTAVNTEEAVTKISTMFPTVSDTHIRILLKKYMKYIFPKAEETMILDILSSNDNNIQKVSEILTEMGFEKRDNSKKQSALSKPAPPQVQQLELEIVPVMKSVADKKIIQSKLEEKYNDIPGQVITIALESVNFDEKRANHILDIMVKEESDKIDKAVPETQSESTEDTCTDKLSGTIPVSQSRQSLKSLLKSEKSDYSMKGSSSFNRIIEEKSDDMVGEYKSSNVSQPIGTNHYLAKGANQELLLEDYVKWQGPSLYQGPGKGLAKGPNPYLRQGRTCQPCGPNAALRKGPKIGLAKGSIFSQLKGVVGGESRGK